MPIKDLKNKINKLEDILNTKADTPAEWALDIARVDLMPVKQYRKIRTEEEIIQTALYLTQTYGTKENHDKALLESLKSFDHIAFKAEFTNPCGFIKRKDSCDLCETPLENDGDFCKTCCEKYPSKIHKIREYRKAEPQNSITKKFVASSEGVI
jgi:hypothetical protein